MKFNLGAFDGYEGVDSGHRWNGFCCPLFTKEVALQILEDVGVEYTVEDGVIYAWGEVYMPVDSLYAIGAFSWAWLCNP